MHGHFVTQAHWLSNDTFIKRLYMFICTSVWRVLRALRSNSGAHFTWLYSCHHYWSVDPITRTLWILSQYSSFSAWVHTVRWITIDTQPCLHLYDPCITLECYLTSFLQHRRHISAVIFHFLWCFSLHLVSVVLFSCSAGKAAVCPVAS